MHWDRKKKGIARKKDKKTNKLTCVEIKTVHEHTFLEAGNATTNFTQPKIKFKNWNSSKK